MKLILVFCLTVKCKQGNGKTKVTEINKGYLKGQKCLVIERAFLVEFSNKLLLPSELTASQMK
jgi:hypothetical protein